MDRALNGGEIIQLHTFLCLKGFLGWIQKCFFGLCLTSELCPTGIVTDWTRSSQTPREGDFGSDQDLNRWPPPHDSVFRLSAIPSVSFRSNSFTICRPSPMLVQKMSIPGHGDSDSLGISTSTRLPDAALQPGHGSRLTFGHGRVNFWDQSTEWPRINVTLAHGMVNIWDLSIGCPELCYIALKCICLLQMWTIVKCMFSGRIFFFWPTLFRLWQKKAT